LRLLHEPGGIWFKVLVAKYEIRDGQVDNGGSRASSWRKVVFSIRCGNEKGERRLFEENIVRRVGDG
jgi:hypothetical protein